jgi:hypothetical protein
MYSPIQAINSENRLFRECPTCFAYCHAIDFNMTILALMDDATDVLVAKAQFASTLDSDAEALRRETISRTQRSEFTLFAMRVESVSQNLSAAAAQVLPRIPDAEAQAGLDRVLEIAAQVRRLGELKDYEAAFALDSEFTAEAAALSQRLSALEATLDRFDGMMARVDADYANVSANAAAALRRVNDSSLSEELGALANVSARMRALAAAHDFEGAFALESGYFAGSAQAGADALGLVLEYSELNASNADAQLKASTSCSGLRPPDPQEIRNACALLAANAATVNESLRPPVSPSGIDGIRNAVAALSADSDAISARIARAHEIQDREEAHHRTSDALEKLFFGWKLPW